MEFSASGITAEAARALAQATGADLFEIVPEKPYSEADVNWKNPLARCNKGKVGGDGIEIWKSRKKTGNCLWSVCRSGRKSIWNVS